MEVNKICFDDFIKTLKPANRFLNTFVDWEKCIQNIDKITIYLNHLNLLLRSDDIQNAIKILFEEYPKAFSILNLLIAVRDSDKAFVMDKEVSMSNYFKSPSEIYDFIQKTGLEEFFIEKRVKDLNDYVFGIEVGLDSNARKNRSGKLMEKTIESVFFNAGLKFSKQVKINGFDDLKLTFGDDKKIFDFVIFAPPPSKPSNIKQYFIECNFYSSGGSKLNEVARAYQELAHKFKAFDNKEFIWITDGQGWNESKNKLQEAYKNVEIYNLSTLDFFISKVKNA